MRFIVSNTIQNLKVKSARMQRSRTWRNPLSSYEWLEKEIKPNIEQILTNLDTPKILELGCGSGYCLNALKDKFPHAECHGVDINFGYFREHRKDVNLHKMDVHKLNFANNSIDLVFCFYSIPIFMNKLKVLTEVHRILKIDAEAFITHGADFFNPNISTLTANLPEFQENYGGDIIHITKKLTQKPFANWKYIGYTQINHEFFNRNAVISNYSLR
jgi:ubiquinone/menaquinone biosynthesis C-methylase UbiE